MTDTLIASGEYLIEVIRDGKHGPEVIQRRHVPNMIVTSGKRQIWRNAAGISGAKPFGFLRIGTCGASPTGSQTNVISPITGTLRTASSKTLLAGTRTIQWVVSYASGAGSKSAANIKEVALLNQHTSPGGSAMSRSTFTPVSKTRADKIKITYRARLA